MKKIVIGSIRPNAGKTSAIIGIMKVFDKKFRYIKPFGDRLIYRRKRLWDYDAALVTHYLGIDEVSENITIGFDHSKLKYTYNADSLKKKLDEVAAELGAGADVLFIEAGKDIVYGGSVHLDTFAIAKHLDADLVFVVSGDDDTINDEVKFLKECVQKEQVKFKGIIINKVRDMSDFTGTYLSEIRQMGIPVLAVLPFVDELTFFTMDYLAEILMAKVLTGESSLSNEVKSVFVGSILTDEAFRHPLMSAEKKLVIVSGDRNDLILAALDGDTAGIILTNNIVPQPNVISAATEKNVPLLLVTTDTYQTSKKLDSVDPLLTKNSERKIETIKGLIKDSADISGLFS